MLQRLMISGFAFALCAMSAMGQNSPALYRKSVLIESDYPFPFSLVRAQDPGPTAKQPKQSTQKANPATKPTADAQLQAALANDPDVLVAKAKVQLAQAELTKAKQAVVLKVMTLKADIEEHKRAVVSSQKQVELAGAMVKSGHANPKELLEARTVLARAQAALAKAETELKLLVGDPSQTEIRNLVEPSDLNAKAVDYALFWLATQQTPKNIRGWEWRYLMDQMGVSKAVAGSIPERIRAVLDTPVKLADKGVKVTFEDALAIIKKETGFEIPFRPRNAYRMPTIESQGEELPVGAWFQLYQDEGQPTFYVREYGILLALKENAPPDAPTLTEFWKQVPPPTKAKGSEPEPKTKN